MKRNLSILFFLCILSSAAVFMGCGSTNQLLVPTEITRPPVTELHPPEPFVAVVAMVDFSYKPPTPDEPKVIGRDYDLVRQIVWEGDPGILMADLVAGALSERGVPISRFGANASMPDNFSRVIKGAVRLFDVKIRRRNVVNVYVETTVEITLSVSGHDVPVQWETSISSNSVLKKVFLMQDDVREALSSAANHAADEAVRRLQERGVIGKSR